MKILEQGTALSQSALWRLQTSIFSKLGLNAWTKKGVPSYMTSNPFTAHHYAALVLAYLRDGLSPRSKSPIDPKEPIYIFDLGAGTGRFCYVFIKHLLKLMKGIPMFEQLTLRYIMTDIVQENLDFCLHHSYLQPFIDQGLIDLAYYHHEQKEPMKLQISQMVLSQENVKNPIVLIGNYFMDTLPQDLLRYKNRMWEEGVVTLKYMGEPSTDDPLEDPGAIEKLQVEFTYRPIADGSQSSFQDLPELQSLIDEYSTHLEGVPFTVPVGGFKAVRYFEQLSKGRLLLISGDQGYTTLQQLKQSSEPHIARHGSFSMAVNYHLMAKYFDKKQGKGFLTSHSEPLFQVFVGIFGGTVADYPELAVGYKMHIDAFEPKDYWNLVSVVQTEWVSPSLDTLLLILKLGQWDPMNFYTFYGMIREQIASASPNQKEQLRNTIHEVWENFYPIHPLEGEFIMNLGVLFFEMQLYVEAIAFLQRSLSITGDNPTTYTNMAACYLSLFNPEAAHRCFEKAKALHDQIKA